MEVAFPCWIARLIVCERKLMHLGSPDMDGRWLRIVGLHPTVASLKVYISDDHKLFRLAFTEKILILTGKEYYFHSKLHFSMTITLHGDSDMIQGMWQLAFSMAMYLSWWGWMSSGDLNVLWRLDGNFNVQKSKIGLGNVKCLSP